MARLGSELHKLGEIINQSTKIEDGPPTRYHLKDKDFTKTNSHDESEPYRKMNYGERDGTKPHKTILMVGETGTGKTKLINAMINYMLDVKREDKICFEITDVQSDRTSAHSQTTSITVYGFYPQESKTDLTIIDTPGYGDIQAVNEKEIAESLLKLIKTVDTIQEVHAVCLVINATQNRLPDRQKYTFDAVQSLFGRDIAENIVLLFTHSTGARPKNALTAVKEAKVKCAVKDKNQPVYFQFDNCQSDAAEEEDEMMLEKSWNLSFRGMEAFFKFLYTITPKSLKMTRDVLQQREQLEENIFKIQSHIQNIDKKKNKLKDAQKDLKKNSEDEVEVHKETDSSVVEGAISVCEENCNPHQNWISKLCNLLCCRTETHNYCTVCTNECSYEEHINEPIINETNAEKKQCEHLEKENDVKIGDSMSIINLEDELQELEKEKIKLVIEAFDCVQTLELIALNTDSLLTLQHVDFLIEKLKEINEPEKAEILENIKKRAGGEKN